MFDIFQLRIGDLDTDFFYLIIKTNVGQLYFYLKYALIYDCNSMNNSKSNRVCLELTVSF